MTRKMAEAADAILMGSAVSDFVSKRRKILGVT